MRATYLNFGGALLISISVGACLKSFVATSGSGGTGTGTSSTTSAATSTATSSTGGACTPACSAGAHATASCQGGKCAYACDDGFASCGGDPTTCETVITQNGNCGACGVTCATQCLAAGSKSQCNDPVEIASGYSHVCALRGDGSVWCWGSNFKGQAGTGNGASVQMTPGKVALPMAAKHVRAGGEASCALLSDNRIACWGDDGTSASTPRYYVNASDPAMVSNLAVGGDVGLAGPGTGLVLNGSSSDVAQFVPSNMMSPTFTTKISGAVAIAAGTIHACAIVGGMGDVYCWGDNLPGELGQGTKSSTPMPSPQKINGFAALDIAAGIFNTCALTSQGSVACWGDNQSGESGGPSTMNPVLSPTAVPLPGNPPISSVFAGGYRSGAIAQGKLYLWGDNSAAQISNSPTTSITSATLYANVDGVVAATSSGESVCALLQGGHLKCWGKNEYYQLGDGTNVDNPVPVDVKWP